MKGYRKGLNQFIEYILNRYSKDEKVKTFKTIYEARKVELETKKTLSRILTPTIKISKETAKLCHDLVILELTKQSIMNVFGNEYLQKLQKANNELVEGCFKNIYSKSVLARLKNEA